MTARGTIRSAAVAVSVAGLVTSLAAPALADHEPRLSGDTRFETATEVSAASFESADSAIVAHGRNFPDALASSYLASTLGAPILLTETDSLDAKTSAELQRLGVDHVYIVGGERAVGASVAATLDEDYDVTRIGGDTRFDTMQLIAEFQAKDSEGGSNVGTIGASGRTALIARADNFADALSSGPVAFQGSFPIILTRTGELTAQADATLDSLDIEYAVVLGGEAAVSAQTELEIREKGITTTRLFGDTRRGTAVAIADFARTQLGFTSTGVTLARGDLFPDALSAGPYGGIFEAPILLTQNPDALGAETEAFLSANASFVRTVTAIGGEAAISQATLDNASSAAGNE